MITREEYRKLTEKAARKLRTSWRNTPGTHATTPRGYPFPLRSWPPDAAIDIQFLAEALDTDVNSIVSMRMPGISGVGVTDATAILAITFPPGLFTAPPSIVANALGAAQSHCWIGNDRTTTTATIGAQDFNGAPSPSVWVCWIAMGT